MNNAPLPFARLAALLLAASLVACTPTEDVGQGIPEGTAGAGGSGAAGSSGSSGQAGAGKAGAPGRGGSGAAGASASGDFFQYTLTGGGFDRKADKSFETGKVWANLQVIEDDEGKARNRLFLGFPTTGTDLKVNLLADGPGTYKIQGLAGVFPDAIVLSFLAGGKIVSFLSEDVTVTLSELEYGADPEAKTLLGQPMEGLANVAGTFQGTFRLQPEVGQDDPGVEVQVSGAFRSGENL